MSLFKRPYELIIDFHVYLPLADEKEAAADFSLFEEILSLHGLGIDHFFTYYLQFLPRK